MQVTDFLHGPAACSASWSRSAQIYGALGGLQWLTLSLGTSTMGIETEMTAPPPGWFDNSTFPPCAVATACTNASPSPCPEECSPFTKRSKAWLRSSDGNPGPLSLMMISASRPL